MHRVEALADRPAGSRPARTHPFHSLIPLPEVLGQVYGVGEGSKQVQAEYFKLLARLGPELAILRDVPLEEIAAAGGTRLAEGIGRMRRGEVIAQAGYDGEYGVIRVFGGPAGQASGAQMGLFAETDEKLDADDAESADTPASSDLSAPSAFTPALPKGRDASVRVGPRPAPEVVAATARSTKIRVRTKRRSSRIMRHALRPASTTSSAPPSSAPTRRWSSSPGRARAKRAR